MPGSSGETTTTFPLPLQVAVSAVGRQLSRETNKSTSPVMQRTVTDREWCHDAGQSTRKNAYANALTWAECGIPNSNSRATQSHVRHRGLSNT